MESSAGCKTCGISSVEAGYSTPLCRPCRDRLSCRPLPSWMTIVIIGIAAALGLGLIRFPSTLRTGVEFERGKKAEAQGRFVQAAEHYRQVVDAYPGFTAGIARLGIAEYRAGHVQQAVKDLQRLEGRDMGSKDLMSEVDGVFNEIEARNPQSQQRGGERP